MSAFLSPALLSACGDFVSTRLGLHFPPERMGDLDRALAAAGRELGIPAEKLAARILAGGSAAAEVDALTENLTVGETYFFREADSLRLFEERILPEMLRSRAASRRLRIWSAACCTGEEPYTIAMILDRAVPDRKSWDITILGTDVNARFLRKAQHGVYGNWSFRATPAMWRERYFRERGRGRYELDPRIRKMVLFSLLNLAADEFPSVSSGTSGVDVIFCRNALMYFEPQQARAVALKFHHALAADGWLVVGAIEAASEAFAPFAAQRSPYATLYRKAETPEAILPAVPFDPVPAEIQPMVAFQAPAPRPTPESPRPEAVAPVPRDGEPSVEEMVATARRHAGERRLEEALLWCERAIAGESTNAAYYYLLSAIQHEIGEDAGAMRSLRRALYLDPDFVLAHVSLARIELSRDRADRAERHLANALTALERHAENDEVPESEGMMAGRLREMLISLQAGLRPERVAARGRR